MRTAMALALLAAACADDAGMVDGGRDAGRGPRDARVAGDAAEELDAPPVDLDAGIDAWSIPADAGTDAFVDPGPAGPEVRIIYITTTDRPRREDYVRALERGVRHLQGWYRDQMGTGKTFRVRDPVVEVVPSAHDSAWFATNDDGGDVLYRWGQNARIEAFALTGGRYDDPENIWVYYVDSDNACGQMGGSGGNGVTALPANDLRGLAGMTGVPTCPGDPMFWYEYPPCRWVGGLGHELGHALGRPHPPGCDEGAPACDSPALMWAGFYDYPAGAHLRDDDRAAFESSAFFAMRGAVAAFDCNAP
jgi:hypothetical protein